MLDASVCVSWFIICCPQEKGGVSARRSYKSKCSYPCRICDASSCTLTYNEARFGQSSDLLVSVLICSRAGRTSVSSYPCRAGADTTIMA